MEVLTAKEAAAFLGGKISYWRLLQLVKMGQVPHIKVGKRILFRKESLINWLSDMETKTMQAVSHVVIGEIRRID